MLLAPVPTNESQRIASLRALKVLDTPPEERFDRITRLAARILNAPLAYVSMVDTDRQWFKSSQGLSSCETRRDVSFCGHAILNEGPLIVPDTLADPRFADNPLVIGEPFIRFYVGCPLNGPGGMKVGTLCVADRKPRELTSAQLHTLRDLAGLVERELNLADVIQLQEQLLEAEEQTVIAEKARADALAKLVESQAYLARELAEASAYVQSLLPEPLDGDVRTRWCFRPCSQLGGDAFGYHWLDDNHFAIYLIDVCGHGVGSALLSVSAMNALRSESLPNTDFRDPCQVLAGLNHAFPMDCHDNRFFTIWYGVFNRKTRELHYASGGHPPALLLTGSDRKTASAHLLATDNLFIGLDAIDALSSQTIQLGPFAQLFIFSDGAYEIRKPDGCMMEHRELAKHLEASARADGGDLEQVFQYIHRIGGQDTLADDFSMLEIQF
ncbi:MAG: SpoIIE family protein phosphatase [Planctomycetes bacterium]|nr:SpoIIE family protein phosphatase [Planctomycetota bacterium]